MALFKVDEMQLQISSDNNNLDDIVIQVREIWNHGYDKVEVLTDNFKILCDKNCKGHKFKLILE